MIVAWGRDTDLRQCALDAGSAAVVAPDVHFEGCRCMLDHRSE
jgi:hypothetical protein